jgi:hypothetical protein
MGIMLTVYAKTPRYRMCESEWWGGLQSVRRLRGRKPAASGFTLPASL